MVSRENAPAKSVFKNKHTLALSIVHVEPHEKKKDI